MKILITIPTGVSAVFLMETLIKSASANALETTNYITIEYSVCNKGS